MVYPFVVRDQIVVGEVAGKGRRGSQEDKCCECILERLLASAVVHMICCYVYKITKFGESLHSFLDGWTSAADNSFTNIFYLTKLELET